ncbi:hypothetical protein Dhaf_2316 [Desulfitobacterium hafniense DCB-2]|uniref:Uncharacterized protein n=1 Tax=Desulfitobacterium hafniense (strain DSM 10664 / DCB-2) TaxID=272564 RepID=B8FTB3_DESHD|nr:hypothetical protein Dhaf_2316 [Desulfitobacterium hafniense DCB-2]
MLVLLENKFKTPVLLNGEIRLAPQVFLFIRKGCIM